MSRNPEGFPQYGHRDRTGSSSSPGEGQISNATTASHAVRNVAKDSSTQFNAEVGRHTTTTYSRDTLQVEDNSVRHGHHRTEHGHVNFNISVAQAIPYHGQAMTPGLRPQQTSTLADIRGPRSLEQNPIPERSRSRSGGAMSDRQLSPCLQTPISVSSSAHQGLIPERLDQANQELIDAVKEKISKIYRLYEILPGKFALLYRVPGHNSMRKELSMQSLMFFVTVENGQLISCLEKTIQTPLPNSFLSASPTERSFQKDRDIENIQRRLDQIHGWLAEVDDLSDILAATQDKQYLPIRQRKGSVKNHQTGLRPSSSAVIGGGVTKRPRQPSSSTQKRSSSNPLAVFSIVNMLTTRIQELQKQCQRLQPPQHDTTIEFIPIPEELERTKAVAVMLCKALCQACPNKNHVHQVLFGLSTWCDLSRDKSVEFNLAFECPDKSETWFIVQSTLRDEDDEAMEVDDINATVRSAPHARRSFSQHLNDYSYAAGEPKARFCLQYYKQGTDDLAVALKHSNFCEHEVFYPDKARLDVVHETGQAIPLRRFLEEDIHPKQQLEMLQKIRLARMLAEAVLKFHSAEWLFCKWDWDNVLIYKIDGDLEPHLRFELWNSESGGEPVESFHRSRQMSHVLFQLGVLLEYIAVGSSAGNADYGIVQDKFGSVYANIIQTCHDMSRNEVSGGDQDMQERFYAKVVAKLEELEDFFETEGQ